MRYLACIFAVALLALVGCDDDSNGSGSSGSFRIDPAMLPAAAVGIAYAEQLTATGGMAPLTWSIDDGDLPPGLTLSAGGLISGVATGPLGTADFTVKVDDASGVAAVRDFSITVVHPPLQIITILDHHTIGYWNQPESFAVEAVGGSGQDYTWSLHAGMLPPGMTLDPHGTPDSLIHGVPTATGHHTFTLRVEDSAGAYTMRAGSITILYPQLLITTPTISHAVVGSFYSDQIAAAGGTGSGYTWSISHGAAPAGLTLNPTGTPGTELSGTPQTTGQFAFTVRVEDSNGHWHWRQFTVVVVEALEIPPLALKDAMAWGETSYVSQFIHAAGGQTPYTWSISQGTLPAGLTLEHTASWIRIRGTTNDLGMHQFTLQVEDSLGEVATWAASIEVLPYLWSGSTTGNRHLLVADGGESTPGTNATIRAELVAILQSFNPQDEFDVLVYRSDFTNGMKALFGGLVPASQVNIDIAIDWINGPELDLPGYGHHLMYDAWEYAFTAYSDIDYATHIYRHVHSGNHILHDLPGWLALDPNRVVVPCAVNPLTNDINFGNIVAALTEGTFTTIP